MKRSISLSGSSLALFIVALGSLALPCNALTPPAIQFSATDSNSVVGPGFIGTVGPFAITNAVFTTKPLVAPQIDFGFGSVTTGSLGGTLTTTFTDSGFNLVNGPVKFHIQQSGGPTTYTAWFNPGNAPFGETTLIGTLPNNPDTAALDFTAANVTVTNEPVSLTASQVFTLGTHASYTSDYEVVATLLPITLSCTASGSGEIGVPFSSLPAVSGGVTPYKFSIASGALPNGIALNALTGNNLLDSHIN